MLCDCICSMSMSFFIFRLSVYLDDVNVIRYICSLSCAKEVHVIVCPFVTFPSKDSILFNFRLVPIVFFLVTKCTMGDGKDTWKLLTLCTHVKICFLVGILFECLQMAKHTSCSLGVSLLVYH